MNIISNNYKNVISSMLKKLIYTFQQEISANLLDNFDFKNYQVIIDSISKLTYDIGINMFIATLESIDDWFFNTKLRDRKRFESKGKRSRTIITPLGIITYNRRIYKDKTKKNGDVDYHITYVDRYIDLPKRIKYDPCIHSLACEYASDTNSLIKVGKRLTDDILRKFNTDKNKNYFIITRQQVGNMLKRIKNMYINPINVTLPTPDNLYIMADEKWSHNQQEDTNNTMIKSSIIFENIDKVKKVNGGFYKNRKELKNRHVIASSTNNVWYKTLDYVYNTYDIEKIKNIYILGDGAKWIKNGKDILGYNTEVNVTNCSDKFHPSQAINNITKDQLEKKLLKGYLLSNKRKGFKLIVNALIHKYPNREKVIVEKSNYLINNWKYILQAYKLNIGCSMESHISHIFASIFTSRPKAYKIESREFIVQLRCLKENNTNIRKHILSLFNTHSIEENINLNISNNNKHSNIPIINNGQITELYKELISISHT